jgi:hypothetical protein
MMTLGSVLIVISFASQLSRASAAALATKDTVSVSDSASLFDRDLKVKAVSRLILSKLGLQHPPVASEAQLDGVTDAQIAAYNLTAKMNKRKMAERAARSRVEDEYYTSKVTTLTVNELPCTCERKTSIYSFIIGYFRVSATLFVVRSMWLQNAEQALPN